VNIAPPTDDSPFFFHMVRVRDAFNWTILSGTAGGVQNSVAVFVLGALGLAVVTLTLLCIVIPLVVSSDRRVLTGAWPLMMFFGSIGLGYILVEISQLQRLIIFLGHPTFSLSVVLLALLSSSGLGSYLTTGVTVPAAKNPALMRLVLLVFVLLGFGILTPYATRSFQESETPVRVLVATATLFPLGLFMGMAFPLGMKLASSKAAVLTPWLWGINGATSVTASVLAVAIALNSSITSAFWTGVGCYAVSVLAYAWASRGVRADPLLSDQGNRRSSLSPES